MKPSQTNRGVSGESRGIHPNKPKLAGRCHRRQIMVPKSYSLLKLKVEKWISSCVLSRTKKGDGRPFRREKDLVNSNVTLEQIWEKIQHLKGNTITIFAKYEWEKYANDIWGISSVNFYVSSLNDPGILRPPTPVIFEPEMITVGDPNKIVKNAAKLALRAIRSGLDWNKPGGHQWADRQSCILKQLAIRPETIDGTYISLDRLKIYVDERRSTINNRQPLNTKELKSLFPADYIRNIRLLAGYKERVILAQLKSIDQQIFKGIEMLNGIIISGYNAEQNNGMKFIFNWIKEQQCNPGSIYLCYCGR